MTYRNEPNCWAGWEASQERDPGDETTVPDQLGGHDGHS